MGLDGVSDGYALSGRKYTETVRGIAVVELRLDAEVGVACRRQDVQVLAAGPDDTATAWS